MKIRFNFDASVFRNLKVLYLNFGNLRGVNQFEVGKAKEFAKIFEPKGYKVKTLKDFPELDEVEETGTTFEENARLKAETILEFSFVFSSPSMTLKPPLVYIWMVARGWRRSWEIMLDI